MKTLRLGLLLALLLVAQGAHALCLGPLCSCNVSTTNVVFGNVNPIAIGATDATGSVRVGCGGIAGLLIPYQIELGPGGSGNVGARRLSSGGNTLVYGLYSDAARLTSWGNSGGGSIVSGSVLLDALGLAPAITHTVYGRIPAGQSSTAPGAYSDTITVTVTYY